MNYKKYKLFNNLGNKIIFQSYFIAFFNIKKNLIC